MGISKKKASTKLSISFIKTGLALLLVLFFTFGLAINALAEDDASGPAATIAKQGESIVEIGEWVITYVTTGGTVTETYPGETTADYGGVVIDLGAPYAAQPNEQTQVTIDLMPQAALDPTIYVSNQTELLAAIAAAALSGEATVIALTDNIETDQNISIPADTTVTLTGAFELKRMNDGTTLGVAGSLTIDGITVTHASGAIGTGVGVGTLGSLALLSGTISGNNSDYSGGGVSSTGTFTMAGGSISNNTAQAGGGVFNSGTFTMTGGSIFDNEANWLSFGSKNGMGGGVYNSKTFDMYAGSIYNNHSNRWGGGVYNDHVGVYVAAGDETGYGLGNDVTIYGGSISNNVAEQLGGGIYNGNGVLIISGGTIANNEAAVMGGGIWSGGFFYLKGGAISGNSSDQGGGVYNLNTFSMTSGTISANTANTSGGGISNPGFLTMTGGSVTNNKAGSGGGVILAYSGSALTLGGTAVISANTSTDGSVPLNLCLDDGQFIILGTGADAPASGMDVYVQTATANGVIVNTSGNATAQAMQYFHADDGTSPVLFMDDQLMISTPQDIAAAVVMQSGTLSYTGAAQTPTFSVVIGGVTLVEGTDYTVTGSQTNAGTYFATITGIDIYFGTIEASYTIDKADQPSPTIVVGTINKAYGDSPFYITAGGDYSGLLTYTSSNPAVATVDSNSLVTLGDTADAIGTTTISIYKKGDENYNASPATTIMLTVGKAIQAPPAVAYEVSGDYTSGGVTVTITSPSSGAAYSTDGITYSTTNPIAFAQGVTNATLYVRLNETATQLQSAAANVSIDFTKEDQDAPQVFDLSYVYDADANEFAVIIPSVEGAEYSFDNINFSGDRTAFVAPGETVVGYMRMVASATRNASTAMPSSLLSLPVPATTIAVSGADGIATIDTNGGTLQMHVDVQPFGASDKAVVWEVIGTGAEINAGGLLTAIDNGTVTVKATAHDGFGTFGEFTVLISGQTTNRTVYPVLSDFGTWTGSKNATAKVDGFEVIFERLLLNGNVVDPSNHEATVGGTTITLWERYLKTLADGVYIFRAEYSDGYVDLVLRVDTTSKSGSNGLPQTGDSDSMILLFAMSGALLLCSFFLRQWRRQRGQVKRQ